MAESRARLLCFVEFAADLEISYNDAVDPVKLRVWLWETESYTLPDDIEVEAESDQEGGWVVAIRETG